MKKDTIKFDEVKQGQIKSIFFTLKILALFFSAVPLFQCFSQKMELNFIGDNYSVYAVGVTLIIIIFAMFFLMFIFNKKKNNKFFEKIEMALFFTMFIIAILFSGANKSYYKFLFLFIIISYTIEYGIKAGLIIATLSSTAICIIDLLFVDNVSVNKYFENDIALFAMFFLVAWTLGYYVKLEKSHIKHLTEYANIDGLTQIYNHRYFYEKLQEKCIEAKEKNEDLAILIVDIDFFKVYNDVYGHQQGDEALCTLVSIMSQQIDSHHILCRYGGEEFSIILPQADISVAIQVGEKIRQAIEIYPFPGEETLPGKCMTVSIGTAQFDFKGDYTDLVRCADSALYRAKHLHRNRVEAFSPINEQYHLDEDIKGNLDLDALKKFVFTINARDYYTYNHMERVVRYCHIFALHLGFDNTMRKKLVLAAFVHDLGKANIDTEILTSPKPLTDEQWIILKRHPSDSAEIVLSLGGSKEIAQIVEQHHERLDGNGYPKGLKNEEISYFARIISIADSFDAMTNYRPYTTKKTYDEAYRELERCSSTQFDSQLVQQFIIAVKKHLGSQTQ